MDLLGGLLLRGGRHGHGRSGCRGGDAASQKLASIRRAHHVAPRNSIDLVLPAASAAGAILVPFRGPLGFAILAQCTVPDIFPPSDFADELKATRVPSVR